MSGNGNSLPWASLVADSPRFEQYVFGGTEVSGTDWVADSVRAGAEQFQLPDKQLAQLWWYSFGNGVIAPAVHLMVGFDCIPSLDLSAGRLAVSGFWTGFSTDVTATSAAESSAALVESAAPLIDALCTNFGLRPAPLWALLTDALRQSALEAGNEHFEPARGVKLATELTSNLKPLVPFYAVEDGEVTEVGSGNESDDMFVYAPRTSCCMVYRSPGSGYCTLCPKRPSAAIEASMRAQAESFY